MIVQCFFLLLLLLKARFSFGGLLKQSYVHFVGWQFNVSDNRTSNETIFYTVDVWVLLGIDGSNLGESDIEELVHTMKCATDH